VASPRQRLHGVSIRPTSRPARHDARRSAAARPGPLPSPLARPRSGVRPGRTCSAGARRTWSTRLTWR